nr:aspartate aminotransferase family protein [Mahella australiensis]
MNTFGERMPVAFDHGEGCVLYDKNSKAYIDFVAGIAVNALGYAHPALIDAVTEQAKKLIHCSSLYYIESQAKLAQILAENTCGDRVFFGNSGAEANEGAIKLARKYFYNQGQERYEIITAKASFHGRTLATLAATGQDKYHKPFEPMPAGFINIPFNDLEAVESAISPTTAAIMVEPVQGEGGVFVADNGYMKGLRKLCDENDLLLIFDEIQTGLGRTGKFFAYEHYGIEPDIFTSAKALGGGIPLGAVMAKEQVAAAFEPGDHGSTFGGGPLACAAGMAVVQTILDEQLSDYAAQTGQYFFDCLKQLQAEYGFITDVRGKGLMLGMELDQSINGKDIVKAAFCNGFLINCAGHNTLRFIPPLIITKNEIDMLIEMLDNILKAYL